MAENDSWLDGLGDLIGRNVNKSKENYNSQAAVRRRAEAESAANRAAIGAGFSDFFSRASGNGSNNSSVKSSLDAVVRDYTDSRGQGIAGQTAAAAMEGAQRKYLASGVDLGRDAAQMQAGRDALDAASWEMVGGVNWGAINALNAQKTSLNKNYATNKADAESMYGTLSTDEAVASTGLIGDIQEMGGQLNTAYDNQIQGSQDASTARQGLLSAEQQRQQANRERVQASLGVSKEGSLMSYASDAGLSKGMADVAASAGSWEDLLRTNQLTAKSSTDSRMTGAANTRDQTILNMKNYLDGQVGQIDSQIAGYKSQGPTRQLTDVGELLQKAQNEQLLKEAQRMYPDQYGAGNVPEMTDIEQLRSDLNLTAQEYANQEVTAMSAFAAYQRDPSAKTSLTNDQVKILHARGIPMGLLTAGGKITE
jgi:hypothetical protein